MSTMELLATRREKRSTAGNRFVASSSVLVCLQFIFCGSMEAALAEMALEDSNKDLDDDNDFVNDKGPFNVRPGMLTDETNRR